MAETPGKANAKNTAIKAPPKAESFLVGKTMNDDALTNAATIALAGAEPLEKNGYKIPLAQTLVRRALARAGGVNA